MKTCNTRLIKGKTSFGFTGLAAVSTYHVMMLVKALKSNKLGEIT